MKKQKISKENMKEPTSSAYIKVRNSQIHGKGVFAKTKIKKGTKIIEYVGEKVTKKESDKRFDKTMAQAKKDSEHGEVYIFELNKKYDIDGDVEYNTARLINHSCDPNCEVEIQGDHIWIVAVEDIKEGEELSYNYSFDFESYEDYPCKCGSKNCVGYILDEDYWPKLKKHERISKNKSKK